MLAVKCIAGGPVCPLTVLVFALANGFSRGILLGAGPFSRRGGRQSSSEILS